MKIKIIKITLATLFLVCFFTQNIFSEEKKSNSNLSTASEEGKQILSDLGSALKGISTTINDEVSKGATKARSKLAEKVIGTWTFSNGNASTTLTCNDDETMTITQKSFIKRRTWTGDYLVVAGRLIFTITGTQNNGEEWTLKYNLTDETSMQISSDVMPDDYNGYDFSEATTFIKQE